MSGKVCVNCKSALHPITIKGYRMLIEDGRAMNGRPIETEACGSCGLVHLWDPEPKTGV